jgi:hypothetical protein
MNIKCPVCEGSGKTWTEPRDAYEGNKGRRLGYCDFCDGGGVISDVYDRGKAVKAYWETLRKLEETRELRKSALAKLTDEEKEAMGWK